MNEILIENENVVTMFNFLFQIFALQLFITTLLSANVAHKPAGSLEGSNGTNLKGLSIHDFPNSSIIVSDKSSYVETTLEEGIAVMDLRKKAPFVPPPDVIVQGAPIAYPIKSILRDGAPRPVTTKKPNGINEKLYVTGWGGTLYPRRRKATSTTISGMAAWPKDMLDAHNRRIKEVGRHMELHYMSTLYLFEEVQRIRRDRVILDELRLMAADLENANYQQVKAHVLKCYKVGRPAEIKPMWMLNTNNLLINYVKDTNHDGIL